MFSVSIASPGKPPSKIHTYTTRKEAQQGYTQMCEQQENLARRTECILRKGQMLLAKSERSSRPSQEEHVDLSTMSIMELPTPTKRIIKSPQNAFEVTQEQWQSISERLNAL